MIDTRAEFSLNGMRAAEIFSPRDASEIARILAESNVQQRVLIPWGGGTQQHLGNFPTRLDAVMDTTKLNQVVEYEPADLTITVQAGMTVEQVQQTLAANHQFLPLDVAHPERATIGGVLATGLSGPLRLHYGPPRDFTLGLRLATVEGHVVKAGGKVVKNVAGYELTKVVVGSFGTLGVITEATFKLFPKPASELTLLAAFADMRAACAVIPKLWNLTTPPRALELLDAPVARNVGRDTAGGWLVAARFGGASVTMGAARENALSALTVLAPSSIEFVEDASALWRRITDLPATLGEQADAVVVRVGVAPKSLRAALEKITGGAPDAKIFAHAATASIYAAFAADDAVARIQALRVTLAELGAHVVVEAAPAAVKRALDVWGDIGQSVKLMRAIKKQFDPNGILNPGRFVRGLEQR